MNRILTGIIFLAVINFESLNAQQDSLSVTGKVYYTSEGKLVPLAGARVFWASTNIGTLTDTDGIFIISKNPKSDVLVAGYVDYLSDTINVVNSRNVDFVLEKFIELEQVKVVRKRKTVEFSMLEPVKIEKIGEGELKKAACCNLSESFETNPSVDVSFTDAITGTKQIQMLGLSGPYVQITSENIPDVRGLSAIYGMEYIPGPWIESIQLNKGTGSVVNGYESIAGQINVEMRKPETADRLYFNLFGNNESRIEGNLNLTHKLNERVSTAILLHARNQSVTMDENGDGFIDKPIGNQYIFLNRWNIHGNNGLETRFGFKITNVDNYGGQNNFKPETNSNLWGMQMNISRYEAWAKLGKVSSKKEYQSFGTQFSAFSHTQQSVFGSKTYDGNQQSGYFNFIFQSAFGDTRYKYRTGVSLQYDKYSEKLDSLNFKREEIVPGVYYEFTFSPNEKFDAVAGVRGDYHNNYGLYFTPRLHLRYAPVKNTVFRVSAGSGQRTASILAENSPVLASSRQLIIRSENNKNPYGLNQEKAWNFGANFTQTFRLYYRYAVFSTDFYYTKFENQVVVDLDESPQQVLFYNLNGKSYSTSFQTQFDYELIPRLDVRLAYRWYNVKTQYLSGLKDKPLTSKSRAFVNLAYSTKKHWKFDYTIQWFGPRRIPSTITNPEQYQLDEKSPAFYQMNAQLSKEWREKFEFYLGVENLLNFKQENPILASNDPFGPYFDSSLIWGPVSGRMIYGGFRMKLK